MLKARIFSLIGVLLLGFFLISCVNADQVTVDFISNGGSVVSSVTVEKGSAISMPSVVKEGHTLDGWYTSLDNGVTLDEKWSFVNSVVSYDLTLYAKWTINEYSISFNSNGGSVVNSINQNYGTTLNLPTLVSKEGYTFAGWYSNVELTATFDTVSMPAQNITLYAKWNINQYTISFESNGGTPVDPITQDYDSPVILPSNLEKENYIFGGWFIDETLQVPYDIISIPSNNIKLYAKWDREDGLIYVESINISFLPTRDNESMIQGISYLPELFKTEMAKQGYYVENVHVNIEISYDSLGEKLVAGTIDVGFMYTIGYSAYSMTSQIEAILTAERNGFNKDSINPKDWNNGLPTEMDFDYKVPYYRSIGIAGITDKGREIAHKVNNNEPITWEDLQTVRFGVQSVSSSAGRVYPSLLFADLYDGKTLDYLPSANIITVSGYASAISMLAEGIVDIVFVYADARRDYANQWISLYGRAKSIWEETDVVFVTSGIYSDVVAISKATVDDELKLAIQQAFINLSKDETMLNNPVDVYMRVKDIFLVMYHTGYIVTTDSDYENARRAYQLLYQ